jgi:sulfopyruvate decarboxylase TPP-binding subunit
MIEATEFIAAAQARGFGLYTGVPCSYLTAFINHVIGSAELRYVGAANEGDAVAIAAGSAIGSLPAVAMFQNSGLGNAVSPLTSLTYTFRIPVLLIVTWRGMPGGAADEPQHALMGAITPGILEQMQIPWALFPSEAGAIGPALDLALAHFARESRPFALVMQKGSVAEAALARGPAPAAPAASAPVARPKASHTRRDMLAAVQAAAGERDILIATTGYTGRELFALGDRPNQLYMVGSMGCAISIALRTSRHCDRRRRRRIDAARRDDDSGLRTATQSAARPAGQRPARIHRRTGDGVAGRGFLRAGRGRGLPVGRRDCRCRRARGDDRETRRRARLHSRADRARRTRGPAAPQDDAGGSGGAPAHRTHGLTWLDARSC